MNQRKKKWHGLKRCLILFLTLALFLTILIKNAYTISQGRTIENKNEFGGYTVEYLYNKGDNAFDRNGIAKIVEIYDDNKILLKKEHFFTNDITNKIGLDKAIIYFRNDKPAKVEMLISDKLIDKFGFYKRETLFDDDGKEIKTRYVDKFGKTLKEEAAQEKIDQDYREARTGITFPSHLGSLKFGGMIDYGKEYNKPELGVSVRYVGDPPTRADIFIYDLGKRALGTGINSPEVGSHFEEIKKDINAAEKLGRYQGVKKVSEFKVDIETVTGKLPALGASFTFSQPGEPYKGVQTSTLLLTAYKGQFIKIRVSYPQDQKEKGEESLKGLLADFGKLLK